MISGESLHVLMLPFVLKRARVQRALCRHLQGFDQTPERDQEVSLQADNCRTVVGSLLQKIHVYWFIN